jgi:hypothetical protein
MAINFVPPLEQLGIMAPYLGRWFPDSVRIAAPTAGGALGASLTLSTGTEWRPPATGFLSLFVASPSSPPAALAGLRDALGNHPFTDGQIVALFTLLPEVEARIYDLMRHLPALTGGTQQPPAPSPTRVRVRSFALALPGATNDITQLITLIPGPTPPALNDPDPNVQRERQAHYLGFELAQPTGTQVRNGPHPMTQLRRPGLYALPDTGIPDQEDRVLVNLSGAVTLWTFDARGRAVDPGAVAAWFSYLVNTGSTDLALGGTSNWPQDNSQPRVCLFDAGRVVHLVNAHEGVVGDPFVRASTSRLQVRSGNVDKTVLVETGTQATSLAFTAAPNNPTNPPHNPAVDDAPLPRVALLPDGNYDSTLTLWPDGTKVGDGLDRDYARVALVDIERHLVGVARADSGSIPGTAAERHRADQNRPSTRIEVAASTGTDDVLLTTTEQVAGDIVGGAQLGTGFRLVVGVADGQSGSVSITLPSTDAVFPNALSQAALPATGPAVEPTVTGTYAVLPLVGAGTPGPLFSTKRQPVLLVIKLETALAGAWVRAWTQSFDFERAEHVRADGGGGRVAADGMVRLVMELPDQVDFAAQAPPGFDLMIATLDGTGKILRRRNYADCRFQRPDLVAGTLPETFPSGATWFVCETGQNGTTAPGDVVPPGATLVIKTSDGKFTLFARSKIPATALLAATLRRQLGSGEIITLTQPAFKSTPDRLDDQGRLLRSDATTGDPLDGLVATGAKVDRTTRPGLSPPFPFPSVPYPTQERLEVAAAWVESGDTRAVIGSAGMLSRSHEILPHDAGHPGSPAGTETHGTGVRLRGPAAVLAARYVLDRTAGLGADVPSQLQEFNNFWVRSEPALALETKRASFPAQAASGRGRWAAVLLTNAIAMEGLPAAGLFAVTSGAYPLSAVQGNLVNWLNGLNNIVPGVNPNLGNRLQQALDNQIGPDTIRALDRRIKTAAEGAREAAFALAAAIGRAEDFVYLETPALDMLKTGPTDDLVGVIEALFDRMHARPGLRVVICAPAQLAPGLPKGLTDVRDHGLLDAVNSQLRLVGGDRVAVFSPGAGVGRSLRMASTTVIVDDVFALTGTTHLWRRGLSFDSSLAAAVFDERLTDGRPQEIRRFRRALLAGRLGVPERLVPDDPAELVRAIQDFDLTGSFRLAFRRILMPEPILTGQPYPTDEDKEIWNPDGARANVTFDDVLAAFLRATTSPRGEVNDPI